MMHDAMSLADDGPVAIRYPRGQARQVDEHEVASGSMAAASARPTTARGVCIIAIGKLVAAAEQAADAARRRRRRRHGLGRPLLRPARPAMLADAARHRAVVTAEDGVRDGGIGMAIADRIGALAPAVPVAVLGSADALHPPRRARRDPRPPRPRRRRHRRGDRASLLTDDRRWPSASRCSTCRWSPTGARRPTPWPTHAAGPARRGARLRPVLGRRAPQHADESPARRRRC